MKTKIVTERIYNKAAYWHVVHEWEDVFSETFELEYIDNKVIIFVRKVKEFLFFRFPKIFKLLFPNTKKFKNNGKEVKLCFVMDAICYRLYTQKNIVPIFLDFSGDMVEEIISATKDIPFFYVTCYAIYNQLVDKKCENVRFVPLSISDKYCSEIIPHKTVDVIQFGRKNDVLHKYMLKYCEEHPTVEYIYQTDGAELTYFSTQKGDIGKYDERKKYFELLSSCKVSLVSSPAVDGTRKFGQGVDFITPRFYESVANFCYMLGRYTENEESKMLNLSSVCENIRDYEQFEKLLDEFLNSSVFTKKSEYVEFLKSNSTSKRCEKIASDIGKH